MPQEKADSQEGAGRSACTECQRRKQKCNRQWPCNHCQKRKVADKCHFKNQSSQGTRPQPVGKKRGASSRSSPSDVESDVEIPHFEDKVEEAREFGDLEVLGYSANHFLASSKVPETKEWSPPEQYLVDAESCPQLQRALQILPARPYLDNLVDNFLSNVNSHYYILYPPTFCQQYQTWWSDRAHDRPLGVEWTCLLLIICACSAQYTTLELEQRLEADLGESCHSLSKKYHNTARELQNVLPVGHNHFTNVQQLLHSCYWFKSEARFIECWHVLSSAVREAQELGIHKESTMGNVPAFEREMHRRVWCILDTWDWQISAVLSRPIIIDRSDCDIGLPTLVLEKAKPYPLLHMKLQSQLIRKLSAKFGLPKNVTSPAQVRGYQATVQDWIEQFPSTYQLSDYDTSADAGNPWIVLHRHYLHTMSHSMLLDPIRAYLAQPMSRSSPPEVLDIRRDGVEYALKLMKFLHGFFDHVWPRDAKFHFVLFSMFDTAAVYASVILHDEDNSVERRDEMLSGMEEALNMISRLTHATKPAELYYDILSRLQKKVLKKLGLYKKPIKKAKLALPPSSPDMKGSKASVSSKAVAVTTGVASKCASSIAEPSAASTSLTSGDFSHDWSTTTAPSLDFTQPSVYASSIPTNPVPYQSQPWLSGPVMPYSTAPPSNEFLTQPELTADAFQFDPLPDLDNDIQTLTPEQLGDLASLWRWETLDLGIINQNPDPAPE